MPKAVSSNIELEAALKPLIIFGKILGLIPLNQLRWNIIILPLLAINVAVELVHVLFSAAPKKSPVDMAGAAGTPLFYGLGLFVYHHMRKNQHKLDGLLIKWKNSDSEIKIKDWKLYRDVNFWFASIFTSAILENIVFHFKLCQFRDADQRSFLYCTYISLHPAWFALIPYHDLLSVYLIISNKLALYAWNFMDILIIVMCRGIYFRFNILAKYSEDFSAWSKLRDEYLKILLLLDGLQQFLSPMIFVSFGMNTYALCMQLNLWLTPSKNKTALDSIYSIWSSLHLIIRVLIVSISAARVNDATKKVYTLTKSCPMQQYSLDLVRLEEMIAISNFGVSGLGCFVVTKRFILSIVSVVFTLEVFLLQSVTDTCDHGSIRG